MSFWIVAILLGLVGGISLYQFRSQRGTYRSLSSRQPARKVSGEVPLGMEATDLSAVNSVARRNESLERSHTSWTRRSGMLSGAADTDIQPLSDDETYAKRYHAAFLQDKE